MAIFCQRSVWDYESDQENSYSSEEEEYDSDQHRAMYFENAPDKGFMEEEEDDTTTISERNLSRPRKFKQLRAPIIYLIGKMLHIILSISQEY